LVITVAAFTNVVWVPPVGVSRVAANWTRMIFPAGTGPVSRSSEAVEQGGEKR
jgi:hypothetical protein